MSASSTGSPSELSAIDRRNERLVLLSVLMALFLAALEQTIVAPALPAITADLGDPHLLPWVATAYLIAITAISPILGAMADIVGRRPILLLSLGFFLFGSVLAALAQTMPWLIGARVVQGVGAGGLITLPFVVIADKLPFARRAAYSAYISTMYAVATVIGPLVGGFSAQYAHWSVIFWINLPFGGAVLVALLMFLSEDEGTTTSRRIDFLGAALVLCAATASVLALEAFVGAPALGVPAPAFLVIALVSWAGFFWRMLTAGSPLVPLQIMTDRTILLCALGMFCVQGTNIGLTLFLPLYFQTYLGLSLSEAGLATLGMLGGVTTGAYLPARMLRHQPRYKAIAVVAAGTTWLASLLLLWVLALAPSLPAVIFATAMLGFGVGSLYPVFNLVTQNAAGRTRVGAALGQLGFMRAMGASMGVAVIGVVAVSIGLTHAPASGSLPDPGWAIALVPACLTLICFLAMTVLPVRYLGDTPQTADRPMSQTV